MKLADVKKGDSEPGDCGNPPDQKPPWLDMEKFNRGREFYLNHVMMITFSMHISLATGLAINNLLVPLVFTNKSNTPEKALKRYVSTGKHILTWFTGDVWDAPNGESFLSVQKVRKMHSTVAKSMNNKYKDRNYLSQYDMALVLSGFMGAVTMYPEKFGIRCTKEELDDYVYCWRGIGYLLGIDDKYNICRNGYEDAYNICKEIEYQLLIPALKDPPKDFNLMSEAYISGTNMVWGFSFFSVSSIVAYSAIDNKWPFDVPAVSWADTIRMWLIKLMILLVWWFPRFEKFQNKKSLENMEIIHNKYVSKSLIS